MKYFLSLLKVLLILSGCTKNEKMNDAESNCDIECEAMRLSFLEKNHSYPKKIIDSICQTLPPMPTALDELGHKENTEELLRKLNSACNSLKIELGCYACLESLPLQSSFSVKIDSMGEQVLRGFRIYVPEDGYMYMNN